jgi:hypothetical protein
MPKYTEEARKEFARLINEYTEDRVQYETEHVDSGEAYEHMVREKRDDVETLRNFKDWLKQSKVKTHDVPIGKLFELVLENFKMAPDRVTPNLAGFDTAFVIAEFPVGEVEISVADTCQTTGVPKDAIPQISDLLDAYVNDQGFGYVSTHDAAWVAYISRQSMEEVIDSWVNR